MLFIFSLESPAILILDGHDSHCTNLEVLDSAAISSLCMLRLPRYTTAWLQLVDRELFGPLKKAYYDTSS